MRYFEAPEWFTGKNQRNERTIFMAGGITGCEEWQKFLWNNIVGQWKSYGEEVPIVFQNLTFFNPRQENFPINDPSAAKQQIWWERAHLMIADEILFWFPKETICPIVLYELGAWSNVRPQKKLYIGTDPEYSRKQDVIIQTRYVRPEIQIVHSLEDLVEQILNI